MRRFFSLLRNAMPFSNAYQDVNTLAGDDLTTEPMFSQLRQFADAPPESGAIPIALLMEFNAAKRRVKGRKKYRFGAGALFATIVLVPSLAYAGVLPTPIGRVVANIVDAVSAPIQSILNAVSIPVELPSLSSKVESNAAADGAGPVAELSSEPTVSPAASPTEQSGGVASQEGPKGENGGAGIELAKSSDGASDDIRKEAGTKATSTPEATSTP